MSNYSVIDIYLDKFGLELTEDEMAKMYQNLRGNILDLQNEDEPNIEELIDPMSESLEELGFLGHSKVTKVADGCKWIMTNGDSTGKHCNILQVMGTKFCKYHNYVQKIGIYLK